MLSARAALLTLAVALLLPATVFAHAEGDKMPLGEYVVEYSFIPQAASVGVQQSILLGVEDQETSEPVAGVPLWVRLSSPDGIVFSTNNLVSGDAELITLDFLPGTAGDYLLTMRQSGDTKEELQIRFTVQGEDGVALTDNPATNSGSPLLQKITIVFLVIAIILFVIATVRSRRYSR